MVGACEAMGMTMTMDRAVGCRPDYDERDNELLVRYTANSDLDALAGLYDRGYPAYLVEIACSIPDIDRPAAERLTMRAMRGLAGRHRRFVDDFIAGTAGFTHPAGVFLAALMSEIVRGEPRAVSPPHN